MSRRTGVCGRCDGPHDGNHGSYCARCAAKYHRDRRAGVLPEPQPRPCVVCGEEFTPRKNDDRGNPAKCCSVACNVRHQNNIRTPEQIRHWRLRSAYGISLADYERMVAAQAGRCAICDQDCADLHVDHCHKTGRVRGLLCSFCNRAIGLLRDDPVAIRRAADYIETTTDVWTFA